MGSDKASLPFDHRTLLQIAVENLAPLVHPLYLAGSSHQHPRAITLPDIFPGLGPLSGIHSALSASPADRLLVFAVDTPLIKTETLEKLIRLARDVDVAVVRTPDGRPHPLCGIYSKRCLGPILSLLESGRLRVDGLFEEPGVTVRYVEAHELDSSPEEFINLNTPEDFSRARQLRAGNCT